MPANPLTHDEATRLREAAAERLRWASAVVKRLEKRGYLLSDPLLRQAIAARYGMSALYMASHYESCAGGVGREPKP